VTSPRGGPKSPISWQDFTVDFETIGEHEFSDTHRQICEDNAGKSIDLDKYMVHANILHVVDHKDKIQKCLDTFRLMNLRQMLVRDADKIIGVIVRQDLFQYMKV